jgi:ribosomal protein L3 glutamine methyltransferase
MSQTEHPFERVPDQLATLRDFVRWGASRFVAGGLSFGHGTANAYDESLALVLHAVHLDHNVPETILDARLTPAEQRDVLALFKRRVEERIPLAYLMGKAWFAGLEFTVDERVLVPRSPIAELIESGFEPWLGGRAVHRILDLCTGSGCIAIACAHAFPEAEVDAVDLSADALAVAAINVERYGLQAQVKLFQSDLFAALGERRYDLIVSNPPYVDAADMAALTPEFKHEPELGLAAGDDGLDIVRRMLVDASNHLEPDGMMAVEVGNSAPALCASYPEIEFIWPEFERGGDGVFLLEADVVLAHQDTMRAALA